MPDQGGPNEIAALSIGLSVDPSGVQAGIDAAVAAAAKGGEDAGKAFDDAMQASAKKVRGSTTPPQLQDVLNGPNRPHPTNSEQERMQPDWVYSNPPPIAPTGGGGDGAGGSGGIGAAVVVVNQAIGVLTSLIGVITRFEKMGETIGNGLADVTKQNLELERSISMLNEQMARSNAATAHVFAVATQGTNTDPRSLDKLKELREKETKDLEAIQNPSWTDRFGAEVDSITGLLNAGGYGVVPHYDSGFQAKTRQYEESRRAADAQQGVINGQINRGFATSVGAGVAGEMSARGMTVPMGLNQLGGGQEPAMHEAWVRALHANTDAQLKTLAQSLQTARFYERQNFLRERMAEHPQ